ncbi:MAG: DM13 domain-containing protein [Paracoccaceae bacterium]
MIALHKPAALRSILTAAALSLAALPAMAGTGTFKGLSNHITTGGVTVEERDGGYVIVLHGDFSFDGAPDPRVGFGNGGKFVDGTDFEVLKSNSGEQVYKVPAGINASQFSDVFIWCRKFAVPLGVAALK